MNCAELIDINHVIPYETKHLTRVLMRFGWTVSYGLKSGTGTPSSFKEWSQMIDGNPGSSSSPKQNY